MTLYYTKRQRAEDFTSQRGQSTHPLRPTKLSSVEAYSTGRAVEPTNCRPVPLSEKISTEGNEGNEEPSLFGLVWAACVFGWFALCALAGAVWLGAKVRWSRFWFRMTTHVDCQVCKKRMHRAPLHYRRSIYPGLPKGEVVSHTYCVACLEDYKRRLELVERGTHRGGI